MQFFYTICYVDRDEGDRIISSHYTIDEAIENTRLLAMNDILTTYKSSNDYYSVIDGTFFYNLGIDYVIRENILYNHKTYTCKEDIIFLESDLITNINENHENDNIVSEFKQFYIPFCTWRQKKLAESYMRSNEFKNIFV